MYNLDLIRLSHPRPGLLKIVNDYILEQQLIKLEEIISNKNDSDDNKMDKYLSYLFALQPIDIINFRRLLDRLEKIIDNSEVNTEHYVRILMYLRGGLDTMRNNYTYDKDFAKFNEIIKNKSLTERDKINCCLEYFKEENLSRDDIEQMLIIKRDPKWSNLDNCMIYAILEIIYNTINFNMYNEKLEKESN